MTFDMVGYVNDTLGKVHKVPTRWIECDLCDGQGYCLKWVGTDGWREEVERPCTCDDGFVQIEEGDSRWDEGTYLHPDEGE